MDENFKVEEYSSTPLLGAYVEPGMCADVLLFEPRGARTSVQNEAAAKLLSDFQLDFGAEPLAQNEMIAANERHLEQGKAVQPDETLPDNVYDRTYQIISKLPELAIKVDEEKGLLGLAHLGTFLRELGSDVSARQSEVLNALTGLIAEGDSLQLKWKYAGRLKDIMPEAEGVPDKAQLNINDPTFKVSGDINKKQISLTDVRGIISFDPTMPVPIPVPAISGITITKIIDENGKPACELKFQLPKLPGVPDSITKTVSLDGEREKLFDLVLEQISKGKGCAKLAELLPSMVPGEAMNAVLPLVNDVKAAGCANSAIHCKFSEAKQIGKLPLVVGPDVSLKTLAKDGGYIFYDIQGITAKLPVPQEILDKLGADSKAQVSAISISPAGANGDRLVRVDFSHGSLKSIAFTADKNGAPRIEDGRMFAAVKIAEGDKTFDCNLNLPVNGSLKDGLAIGIGGDGEARAQLVKKLGVPAELAEAARFVRALSISDSRIHLSLEKSITANIKGIEMRLAPDVILTESRPNSKSFAVDGVEISGFNFAGEKWKEVGSLVLNRFLEAQRDLPIKLSRLSFSEFDNGQCSVSFSASAGGVKSGYFVLSGKDNPEFVSGSVRVKNPFRYADPTILWNRDRDAEVEIQLDANGIRNPVEMIDSLCRPILNSPLLWGYSQARGGALMAYEGGKLVWRFAQDPEGAADKVWQGTKEGVNTVTDAAGDAGRFIGRNAGDAGRFIGRKAGKVLDWILD